STSARERESRLCVGSRPDFHDKGGIATTGTQQQRLPKGQAEAHATTAGLWSGQTLQLSLHFFESPAACSLALFVHFFLLIFFFSFDHGFAMMRERRQQRRVSSDSPHRHQRQVSDFALNAENGHHPEPPCCSGCHGCAGGSARKKSPLRRAANVFRLRLRQVASAGRKQGLVGLASYLVACVLLVWLGLNIPALMNRKAGGVVESGVRTEVRGKGE
ncbi:unnamed protein product, partial [Laminaria digitata]